MEVRVLTIDDDSDFVAFIDNELAELGYEVATDTSAAQARQSVAEFKPDVCLVDLMLPGASGRVLCSEISQHSDARVIVVTASDRLRNKVEALEAGADDYIIKPIAIAELTARIRAQLRRRYNGGTFKEVRIGRWLYISSRQEIIDPTGVVVPLTSSEARLVEVFVAHPKRVFSREALLAICRSRTHAGGEDRSIDMMIGRLRAKLGDDPKKPKTICTIWGQGYSLGRVDVGGIDSNAPRSTS